MKPIVLIGMMGSGKTTIGKRLAKELNLPWIDTDSYIEEKEQQRISTLFETKGESYFRSCERDALFQLIHHPGILSTGGGIIIQEKNRECLKQNAYVIFLKTEILTLVERLTHAKDRPLLQDGAIEDKLKTLYQARQSLYESCAHLIIQTDHLTESDIIQQIKQHLLNQTKTSR
ncbi:MAG: shikimate kinase [Turicibacter sp.]|nr:shikimate kinase [Turicibacter sp.]